MARWQNLSSSSTFLGGLTVGSRPDSLDQKVIIEGFRQKFNRNSSHGLKPNLFVTMRSNKDGRDFATFSIQLGLQFQTGHSGHTNISNQTRGLLLRSTTQENPPPT
jgi:hypothetical protein